ncbi:tigger transposable element-derived protein 6-like [Patiria miniata]|uniref:DDE-1 domain-containing protein n=1 Tax=Patiria miniata TaxID=46514 RepID=A0A914BM89_PATMI|nr:tigger transposable element-derived protein 6-like [Patiria miniata]
MAFKGEQCHGGKQSKDRVTVLLCANMDGSEKLKPVVIGKFQNPRCFKNVKYLPVMYRANRKAWMVLELFTEWICRLDRWFARRQRKVLMFVDNCAAHPHVQNLEAVTLVFLPPNTTSHLQPMDQGVIMNFKVNYRRQLLQHLLQSYDSGVTPKAVNVKEAIDMTDLAWRNVKADCIACCFAKAGFVTASQDPEGQDQDPEDCTEEPTEEQIAESVTAERAGAVEEEPKDKEEAPTEEQRPRNVTDCLSLMHQVRDYLCSQPDMDDDVYDHAAAILQYLSSRQQDKMSQRKITDFFKV